MAKGASTGQDRGQTQAEPQLSSFPWPSDGTPLWHELGKGGGWEEEGPGMRAFFDPHIDEAPGPGPDCELSFFLVRAHRVGHACREGCSTSPQGVALSPQSSSVS